MKLGIDVRKDVLLSALYVEGFIANFLAVLLGLKNAKDSMSFGNTSKALSFNQKVNLLIDIGALKKQDQNKFITFMEIRNQFVHNMEAKTYELCFSFIKDKDKFILKTYPQPITLTREKQLERAVNQLAGEVTQLSLDLVEKIKEKASKDATSEFYEKRFNTLLVSIDETQKFFDEYSEKIQKNKNFKLSDLGQLGKAMYVVIFAHHKQLNEGKKSKPSS